MMILAKLRIRERNMVMSSMASQLSGRPTGAVFIVTTSAFALPRRVMQEAHLFMRGKCFANETYRIVVAWSKSVRENQGQIVKIWCNLADVRVVAGFRTPEACSAHFGAGGTPFQDWQKDVFEQKD